MSKEKLSIFWFRRDLRFDDNCGLYHALDAENKVLPLFIFDRDILDDLEDEDDARVSFIHNQLTGLNEELKSHNTTLITRYGKPEQVWKDLMEEYFIESIYTNRDYDPYAKERDANISKLAKANGIAFHDFKDQVIFEHKEITKDDGEPYVVFTPYSKKWKSELKSTGIKTYPSALYFSNWFEHDHEPVIPLEQMGFKPSSIKFPTDHITDTVLEQYGEKRNFPATDGTSRLGVHLRFGTISIRKLVETAKEQSDVYLNELIWREFYQMILSNFPEVVQHNFRRKYDAVKWRNNEAEFKKWCEGKTGYPIVDAGMRELNTTGYMHNRVRMITASFLTKHLLIDWRWGEAYFAKKLLDYELASNNGGWQWAAGTGTDAQPYFRIFNPESQTKKFDAKLAYINEWVPEFDTEDYPEPIVDHKAARERALDTFKSALN